MLKGSSVLNESKGPLALEVSTVLEGSDETFVALETSPVPNDSGRDPVVARVPWVSEDSSDEISGERSEPVLEAMTPAVLVEGVLELL